MATVNIKFDSAKITQRVRDIFDKVASNKDLQNQIGEFVVERIKAEARREQPVNKGRSFPGLKQATIANRRRLGKLNTTQKTFKAERSNLTLTGQLIDAVTFEGKNKTIRIFVEATKRIGYKTSKKSKESNPPDNAKLDSFLRAKGFKLFTAQGVKEFEPIPKRVKALTLRFLRRALKFERLRR